MNGTGSDVREEARLWVIPLGLNSSEASRFEPLAGCHINDHHD